MSTESSPFTMYTVQYTVKPVSGHARGLANRPFNTGLPLNSGSEKFLHVHS